MTNLPDLCLAGKIALVTGAGRGIGASIALNLAKAGADVIVNDLDRQAANETAGSIDTSGQHALSIQTDIGDEGAVQTLVAEAARWRGHLDILVCNAGISETESIFTLSPDTWERVIRTNLTGTFLCAEILHDANERTRRRRKIDFHRVWCHTPRCASRSCRVRR